MTNLILATTGAVVVSYLIGSIPFGLLIGKLHGIDIRERGSGNIGATNVTRTIGRNWGILCFSLDFGKGLVPVIIAQQGLTEFGDMPAIMAAAAAIAGHIWPLFLHFKGGKGMAVSLGALIALAPVPVVVCVAVWYLVFRLARYVSLASISGAVALPVVGLFVTTSPEVLVLLIVIAALIIYRHRTNIMRLIQGRENRFKRSSKREQK